MLRTKETKKDRLDLLSIFVGGAKCLENRRIPLNTREDGREKYFRHASMRRRGEACEMGVQVIKGKKTRKTFTKVQGKTSRNLVGKGVCAMVTVAGTSFICCTRCQKSPSSGHVKRADQWKKNSKKGGEARLVGKTLFCEN